MSTFMLAAICAALVGLGLIAYAILGGADFGAGIWDFLARGPLAARERTIIDHAIGPVWEANNVWLVYVIVITWTAFPIVYASVATALFVPLVLALIGIIFRGAAFGFHSHFGARAGMAQVWGRVFSLASTITPFLLGAVAGAIASGEIRVMHGAVSANYWTTWLRPFALACGAFAVGLCSVLSATYLTVEAIDAGDWALVALFRARALVAGAVTAVLGLIAGVLGAFEAPVLWAGLIGAALPLSLGAVLIGLLTAAALLLGYYRLARVLVAAETACIFAAWAVAQYPHLIVPDVTIANAASPRPVLVDAILATLAGMVILLPSLWYLFHIFKSPAVRRPTITAAMRANAGVQAVFGDRPTGENDPVSDAAAGDASAPARDAHAGQQRQAGSAIAGGEHASLHVVLGMAGTVALSLVLLIAQYTCGRLRDTYDLWRVRASRRRVRTS